MSGESDLVVRLRRGDTASFEQLVRAHGGTMLAVARRLVRNEADAKDCVQEAFLRAFQSIDSFEGRARLGTWLHRIVVNVALGKVRTKTRRAERSIEDLLPEFDTAGSRVESERAAAASPEANLESAEIVKHVRGCIDQLPEHYRNVLILRDIEGYATDETGTFLGMSPGAVKTRLHRARAALKTFEAGTRVNRWIRWPRGSAGAGGRRINGGNGRPNRAGNQRRSFEARRITPLRCRVGVRL
jgi:RNA polymerase sigma-70 factor (ECF subfamily)